MFTYTDEQWVEWIDTLSGDDFLVIDDFLPASVYELVMQVLTDKLNEDEFHKAGLGSLYNHQIVSAIRGDFTYWLDQQRDVDMEPFFSLVREIIEKLNQYCFLSLSGHEFHFAYYPPGTFYKKHIDRFKERSNRMISIVIYLNDSWQAGDGGELKLYGAAKGEILVEPLARRCVMFKSDTVEHEVMKTNVNRYSLTGWLLYQPSSVGYLLT